MTYPPITVVKTPIIAKSRKLNGKWVVENIWDIDYSKLQFKITETKHREWCIDLHSFWSERHEVIEWCKETFGPHGNHRRYKWRINFQSEFPNRIFLRKESDVMLFILKWKS